MRPTFMAWLEQQGLERLAGLVPTPGLLYGVVVLVIGATFLLRARASGIGWERGLEAILAASIGAGIGTRLFYLIASGDLLRLGPVEWLDPSRGTASWGAYLGAMIGLTIYGSASRLGAATVLDPMASVAGLGDVVGRWACLLAGDDFGRVTTLAWGIRFPEGSLAWRAHLSRGLIPPEGTSALPVHPMQLYLMLHGLLVFVLCTVVWRRHGRRPGVTFAAFLAAYGGMRFWWEFLRDPSGGGAVSGLSTSQWMCLVLATSGAIWLLAQAAKGARGPVPAPPAPATDQPGTS